MGQIRSAKPPAIDSEISSDLCQGACPINGCSDGTDFLWMGSPSSCLRSGRGKWLSSLYLQEVWKMQLRPICFLSKSVKSCLGFCSAPNRSRLKGVQCGELLPDCAASAMTTVMVRFKNAERGRYLARRDDKVIVLPKDAPFTKDEVAWKLGIHQKPVLTFANDGMKSVSSLELYNVTTTWWIYPSLQSTWTSKESLVGDAH